MQDVPKERGEADVQRSSEATARVRFAGLVLDLGACTLARESGEAIPLTRNEFRLLRLFVDRPGRVLSRDVILNAVASRPLEPFDRSVDSMVVRLRRKIEPDLKQPQLIVTVPGEGYRFDGLERCASRFDLNAADFDPTQVRNVARPVHVHSLEVGQPAETKPAAAGTATVKHESAISSVRASGRASRWPVLAVITALLLFAAAGGWAVLGGRLTKTAQAAHLAIVVLPFANLSGDPAQDYLAEALTDELITSLARIHDSFVIARNTAFTYKGKPIDAKEIGKELGVRYVLEGSMPRNANQVRVNAQLIDAESGAHLWGEQFDASPADLLQMQDEIVTHLARALDIQLTEAEAARLKRTRAASPEAEDLALQCDAVAQKGGKIDANIGKEADEGYRLCEQALSLDPNNVYAMSVLSQKFWVPVAYGLSPDPQGDLKRGDDLVSKALTLDPNYPRAHNIKAWILTLQGRLNESIAEAERALALDPAAAFIHTPLPWDYVFLGQFEKSLEISDKQGRWNPRDPSLDDWYRVRMLANFGLKHYNQAIELARQAIAIKPDNGWTHINLVAALALAGHETEAHEALQNYLTSVSTGPKTIATWKAATVQYVTADSPQRNIETHDRYLDGLRKAGMPEE